MTEKLTQGLLKFSSVLLVALSAVACAVASVDKSPKEKISIVIPKNDVTEGGVFLASVVLKEPAPIVEGTFLGRIVHFFPDPGIDQPQGTHRYSALVGVDYGAAAGTSEFLVRAKTPGENLEARSELVIKSGEFPSEKLSVPPRTVTPTANDRKKIQRDRVLLGRVYANPTQKKLWESPLVMPVESAVTSAYGSSRVYNGKKQNVHLGTDLKAATGTPLLVPLSGRVGLARKLFLTGNTVILDHGFGFFTIYAHLSSLKVKEGQLVKQGKVMGLSGATGRVSGPHLHWGINLNGTRIDPLLLADLIGRKTQHDLNPRAAAGSPSVPAGATIESHR